MTLTEALLGLYRAGRIASPWLPGMLVTTPEFPDLEEDRIVDVQYPGPRPGDPVQFVGAFCRLATPTDPEGDRDWIGHECAPVLTDAATVGCLLALLREASGCPIAQCAPCIVNDEPEWTALWGELDEDDKVAVAATEGEALAAALIAMAREVA